MNSMTDHPVDLEVPSAAIRAMLVETNDYENDEQIVAAVTAIASPVVAAELRRIADQMSAGMDDYVRDGASEIKRAEAQERLSIAKKLRGRADRLDAAR